MELQINGSPITVQSARNKGGSLRLPIIIEGEQWIQSSAGLWLQWLQVRIPLNKANKGPGGVIPSTNQWAIFAFHTGSTKRYEMSKYNGKSKLEKVKRPSATDLQEILSINSHELYLVKCQLQDVDILLIHRIEIFNK